MINHSNSNQYRNLESSPMDEAAAYAALSQIALGGRPPERILGEVAALVKRALPETPEASVTLLGNDRPRTAVFSADVALKLDERQYDDGHGPCLDAAVTGGAIQVAMGEPDSPYPDLRQSAQREGVTHSLSVGIPAAGRLGAALNLYTSTGKPFTADSTRIAGTFAGVVGFALTAVGRDHDAEAVAVRMQPALASRAVISQAQGVLMAELHCSREQAFTRLIQLSQERGVRLRETARVVVDQAARQTADR